MMQSRVIYSSQLEELTLWYVDWMIVDFWGWLKLQSVVQERSRDRLCVVGCIVPVVPCSLAPNRQIAAV